MISNMKSVRTEYNYIIFSNLKNLVDNEEW